MAAAGLENGLPMGGFGFNLRSLRDQEQVHRPEIPIRTCLAFIQRDPQAVSRTFRGV